MATLATGEESLLSMRLLLRSGLKFYSRLEDGGYVIVEDVIGGSYYRIGLAENALIRELDGKRTLDDARLAVAASDARHTLSDSHARTIARWLLSTGLARNIMAPVKPEGLVPKSEPTAWNRFIRWFFWLRVPLGSPEGLLNVLAPRLLPVFSFKAVIIWAACCLATTVPVLFRWPELTANLHDLFRPHRQVGLILGWLVLKIFHELGHALACKRYGGHVREIGVTFVLGMPLAYVDVTSAWRLASKWQRIHVSLAGVYAESIVGCVAAAVWLSAPEPVWRQVAADWFLLSTVGTLLFNLNPLMRFDGYYVLSDLFNVPNLYDAGRESLRQLVLRYLLGVRSIAPHSSRHSIWVILYGAAAWVWRVTVTVGLIVAAAALFHGAGALAAIGAVLAWHVAPLVRLGWALLLGTATTPPPSRWRLGVCVLGAASLLAGLFLIPADWRTVAPAIVEYDPPAIVRAPSDGFVSVIFVSEGSFVRAGTPLCALRNDDLALEAASLATRLAQCRIRQQMLLQKLPTSPGEMTKYQAITSDLVALEKLLKETRVRLNSLTVCAPVDGCVVRRRLDALRGTYVRTGDEILSLGREDVKRLRISLPARYAATFAPESSQATAVFPGIAAQRVSLSQVEPRASLEPSAESLCAPFGGPLAVERSESDTWQLTEPRITATATLLPEQARELLVGQRGVVVLGHSRESLGSVLLRELERLAEKIWQPE